METILDLSGKVALVTGAGRGIGRGIALRLASHGADIAVNDLDPATAERTIQEVRELGREAIAVPADVSQRAQSSKWWIRLQPTLKILTSWSIMPVFLYIDRSWIVVKKIGIGTSI